MCSLFKFSTFPAAGLKGEGDMESCRCGCSYAYEGQMSENRRGEIEIQGSHRTDEHRIHSFKGSEKIDIVKEMFRGK